MPARRCILLLLGVGLLALGAGCAGDRQVAPVPSAPDPDASSGLTFIPAPSGRPAAPQAAPASVTRWISASFGGEIAVAGMRVRFPAGSLPSSRSITLVVDTNERVKVSVRPAGINLRSPAIIQLDNLRLTDGTGYHGLAFYQTSSAIPAAQPTSNDWRTPQAWVSTTGDFFLGGTRWDIPGVQFIRYLAGTGYTTQLVSATSGGSVSYDRVKLSFPPGALYHDTFITIHQVNDDGFLAAELEPHGLQFMAPVTLAINLGGLGWQPYTDWDIFWHNEATGEWVNQGGVFANQTVSGTLYHFSEYAPARGRAGW